MLGTIPTILFATLAVLLVAFWRKVRRYPSGPFPLPVIGNLWSMKRWPQCFYKMGPSLGQKYGDPLTLWFGWFPIVVANDLSIIKEASVGPKRSHLAGRLQFSVGTLQKRGNEDIVFGKFGPEWEALRKVAHLAVRKYAVTEGLENLVTEVIDDIIDHSSPEEPFDLDAEMLEALHNIIGLCVFGQKYERDSEDLRTIRRINGELKLLLPKVFLIDFMPPLRLFLSRYENRSKELFDEFIALEMRLYKQARETFEPGQIRHFTDAIVAAKLEAEEEARGIAKYLTEGNLTQIVYDVFGAATPTTSQTLKWLLLYAFADEKVLARCRAEIESQIGDRQPRASDRNECPFINACILEVLRIRPVSPFSLPHLTTCDTSLAGRPIPKDTTVLFNLYSANHDPRIWEDPETFEPERFLGDEGALRKDRVAQLTTFGVGARACIGEKMAFTVMFVLFTRFLQRVESVKTRSGAPFDLEPKSSGYSCEPKPQPLTLVKFEV
ncbi:cytochrome P450 1A1 [Galendromus occidentalis]|uniref:Cytochrome P450 1A1 n=1 Tax=Galendromus occidentalis TaxID=34638 RepID=A0AAJ6QVL0_9ACAR|nr:cytochrome P450 1A1 [Galendromus occidentalis]